MAPAGARVICIKCLIIIYTESNIVKRFFEFLKVFFF